MNKEIVTLLVDLITDDGILVATQGIDRINHNVKIIDRLNSNPEVLNIKESIDTHTSLSDHFNIPFWIGQYIGIYIHSKDKDPKMILFDLSLTDVENKRLSYIERMQLPVETKEDFLNVLSRRQIEFHQSSHHVQLSE